MPTFATNALWGARCRRSARRVLTGGTSTRGHAGSVRSPVRKRRLRQGSAKANASRLVSTGHSVRHDLLLAKVAQRVSDAEVLHLLKLMLKSTGKRGVPQGGVISPLLSNVYLNEVDKMLERAKVTTRQGQYTYVEYARYADGTPVQAWNKWGGSPLTPVDHAGV